MTKIGDYNLIEEIGAGGMGQVWLAENMHTRLRYAVKLLPQEATQDKNFVARFFDEGRVMAQLEHPHIVRVHHVGQDGDQYFLVMDYIAGPEGKPQSLHDLLMSREAKRLTEEEVKGWARQLAEALAYAHGNGVVHRDIKPANIMVDGDGKVRITDFGLAKAVGEEYIGSQIHQSIKESLSGRRGGQALHTLSDQATIDSGPSSRSTAESLLGTYDYMSPEQRGELGDVEVGPASDVYAFGVMLYRLLTGRRPTGRAKAVSEAVPGLSKSWDPIVDRCLEHEPAARFADGAAVLAALGAVAGGRKTEDRGRRWAVAILVLVVLLVGGGLAVWLLTAKDGDKSKFGNPSEGGGQKTENRGRKPEDGADAVVVPPPAESKPEPMVVAPVSGRLKLVGQEGAEIYLDGRLLGRVNTWVELPGGRYNLELRQDGFRNQVYPVELSPGQALERACPSLTQMAGSIQVRAVSTVQGDTSLNQRQARVRLDGGTWKHVTLPYVASGLPCRSHRVECQVEGYTLRTTSAVQALVSEGHTAVVSFSFSPEPGRIVIDCAVAEAQIFDAKGKQLGATGETLSLAPFVSHVLTVTAPGYESSEVALRIMEPGKDMGRQTVKLEAGTGAMAGQPWEVPEMDLTLAYVAPGSFQMGSNTGERNERPSFRVTLTKGYWIGIYEVTQGQYKHIMGTNPSHHTTVVTARGMFGSHKEPLGEAADKFPVENVSWTDATSFCRRLTTREREAGRLPKGYVFRLPTEAEWEFAARGGAQGRDTTYAGSDDVEEVAWHGNNCDRTTQTVGTKKANELGLYDMSGNVWEWCYDLYDRFTPQAKTDPKGATRSRNRVRRGGAARYQATVTQVTSRYGDSEREKHAYIGFRVVLGASLD